MLSPREVVERAVRAGLTAISLTDHDTVAGLSDAATAAASRLDLIPGVELSADDRHDGRERGIHILGYFIDPTAPVLTAGLDRLRRTREERVRAILDRLAAFEMPLDADRLLAGAATGTTGRPQIARALVEAGYVGSVDEAFLLYLGPDGPAFVERLHVPPVEAVRVVRAAGGAPVLAHPVWHDAPHPAARWLDLDRLLPDLVDAGLTGLEVSYPNYDETTKADLRRWAARFNLIATGGSDDHGPGARGGPLGAWCPPESLASLRRAAGINGS